MIKSHDRSGWFGASDTGRVMGRWDGKSFEKWWLVKLGVRSEDFATEAMKTGTSKAVDLATFPDEIIKQEYLLSPQHIIDYEIESEDVVSDSLVAYTLLIKDNIKSDVYTRVYYFVGNLDGKYTVFINVDYVPENLRAGLNVAKYSYVDEDSLGSSGSVSE